ncbi:ATP-grasp domain-containing protein [Halobacillus sp. Nhm2S1]|uniref:ATP-grasp domain-containing protein n=1 Tax=Halobacillus sp. Nhm2S1 TaxID=2866716 RepID=UPI001C7312DE|nr:ATP-grasp domain-containing protein [Halobacillus sp. Nhm2S1]MBX0359452.1 ATP-grasp domain-containing protein [Halobacillus sp. Nhm2S1]
MSHNFMVIGGSSGQVPAIMAAKKLGLNTIVIDKNSNCPGSEIADYFESVDTTNLEEALRVAKKYNVCGSITISSDIGVLTSCYINEFLGLPNQGLGIGMKVTNKALMRRRFEMEGVNSPYYVATDCNEDVASVSRKIEDDKKKYPMIVKPSDSSGSRGVTKIKNESELKYAIELACKFSRNGKVVVEEFVKGREIGAQCFSKDGRMVYCFVHNDKVSKNLVPVGHSFPSLENDKVLSNVMQECDKALTSLGIVNGPSNIDIIVDEQNTPYIIEIGARIGATKLPELVNYHSGIDIIEKTIQLSSGVDVRVEDTTHYSVAVEMIFFEKGGRVKNIENYDDILKKYSPLEFNLDLRTGMDVKELESGVDVYGHAICKGKTAREAEMFCNKLVEEVKAKIQFCED